MAGDADKEGGLINIADSLTSLKKQEGESWLPEFKEE